MTKTVGSASCAVGVLAASLAALGSELRVLTMHHVVALIALAITLNSVGLMLAVRSVLNVGPVKTAFHLGVQAGRTCLAHGPATQVLHPVPDEVA